MQPALLQALRGGGAKALAGMPAERRSAGVTFLRPWLACPRQRIERWLGDSGAVRDGQEVAITGFPLGASLGLVPVTHRGIVSAVTPVGMPAPSASQLDARTVRRLAMGAYNVFQLDLVSYPGNSGSPLFDTHSGEVVGILNMVFVKGTKESAVAMPTGISYAIPAHYLKALLVP